MPIQRTLSPVPPLGKKTIEPIKLDYLHSTNQYGPTGTPLVITPPSSCRSRFTNATAPNSEMSGVISNLNYLSLTDDTDDDDDESFGTSKEIKEPKDQPTEHKLMYDKGILKQEPLLTTNPHRFVLFPIQDNEVRFIFKFYNMFPHISRSSQR
jgi:hypothetical protein